jgi:hypothetical protein
MHRREMNHTEEKYAQYLETRLRVGEIRWWGFESWKFRLADKTYYSPDFIVVDNLLRIEAHEVKTEWSTGRPGWQEDARVKIKIAAEMHPIRFLAMTLMKDGSWQEEQFGDRREEPVRADLSLISEALGWAQQKTVEEIVREIVKLRALPHV